MLGALGGALMGIGKRNAALNAAALELARSVVRRAERRVISLDHEGLVPGDWLVPWLNRLADVLWVYARLVEQAGPGTTVTVRT